MELVDKSHTEETPTLRESLKKLIEQNDQGGEITLNDFCKLNPHATRSECVRALKKSGAGVFITGRRKKPSRFVYGPPAIPFLTRTNTQTRRDRRVEPQAQPQTPKPQTVQTPTISPVSTGAGARFELRVGVGDQVTTIPIRIELGLAAA